MLSEFSTKVKDFPDNYIQDFWNLAGDPTQAHETQNFVKNLGILAGLLILSKEE